METKNLPCAFKSADLAEGVFTGYAGCFNNLDDVNEIIEPGAFKDTLPEFLASGIVAWQHDWTVPIGKPLEAREDQTGLYVRARISDTTQGRDALTLLRDKVVTRMSIGFKTLKSEKLDAKSIESLWRTHRYQPSAQDRSRARGGARVLKQIQLYEFSLVSVPANRQAVIESVKRPSRPLSQADLLRIRDATARALQEDKRELKRLEEEEIKAGLAAAERQMWRYVKQHPNDAISQRFLQRLSDKLAREAAASRPRRPQPKPYEYGWRLELPLRR